MTTGLKAAQIAGSVYSTASSTAAAVAAGTATWSSSLGLVGVPLVIKSIFDLAGLTGPELGKNAIDFFRNEANNYKKLYANVQKPDSRFLANGWVSGYLRKSNEVPGHRGTPAQAQANGLANIKARFRYYQDLVEAYDKGGYAAIYSDPVLAQRANNEWQKYISANSGY